MSEYMINKEGVVELWEIYEEHYKELDEKCSCNKCVSFWTLFILLIKPLHERYKNE